METLLAQGLPKQKSNACNSAKIIDDIRHLLGHDGPLARHLPGFVPRHGQQDLAQAVAAALASQKPLLAEAGTGIGKTIAYLLPVLLCRRKVVISTGTRHLQDQLFHRDLPRLQKALGAPCQVSLLKGRANYLCRYRFAHHQADLFDSSSQGLRQRIAQWQTQTESGDIQEIGLPEKSGLLSRITSTTDNCLGQACPDYQNCFVLKARRRAQQSQIVVVNHYLLLADLHIKEDGFGQILPEADSFVLDEAHQLPAIGSHFFGRSISSWKIMELLRDSLKEQKTEAPDMADMAFQIRAVENALTALHPLLGKGEQRVAWQQVLGKQTAKQGLLSFIDPFDSFLKRLEMAAERAPGLEKCHRRAQEIRQHLEYFLAADSLQQADSIRWYEGYRHGFSLHESPLEVAPHFRNLMAAHPCAWIFLSATLSIGGKIDFFRQRIGLEESAETQLDSPFDYQRNALLYLPQELPLPMHQDFPAAFEELVIKLLRLSGGRAFVLFTSHRALKAMAARLQSRIPYPLLVQGEDSRFALLRRFHQLSDAVLLGTSSFWEGVDVQGDALSCVIINKLPFEAITDPVLQARLQALKMQQRDPFTDYQLPQAVLALKQGAGRLIRSVTDRGVLVIADKRLQQRPYGKLFLDSLPPMRRTQEWSMVDNFFAVKA